MIHFTPVINWGPYYITIVYPSRWCVHNAAKKSQVKWMCTKYQRSTTRRRDHGFFSYQKSGHFGKLGRFLANPTECHGTEWRELREIWEVHQREIRTKEKRFCKRDKASPIVKKRNLQFVKVLFWRRGKVSIKVKSNQTKILKFLTNSDTKNSESVNF